MDRRTYLATSVALLAGCSTSENKPSSQDTEAATVTQTSSKQAPTSTAEEKATQEPTETPQQSADVLVGDVVGDNALQMVVRDVSRTKSINEIQQADSGNEFVVVRLAVKNITENSDTDVSELFQTRIKDSQNYTYQPALTGGDQAFQGGTLAPGEVSRGDLFYEIPTDTSGLSMQFDFAGTSLFDYNRVTIDLENQTDTIADISQNLRVDVHSAGDAIESGGLEVTVNSIEYRTAIGSFSEAADGYEYAIVDITTANSTDQEISVSSLLQMECKDGRGFSYSGSLTAMSQLDQAYPQGSSLGPGEERRGKVPYEIPTDAEPLYWMFEFSVLVNGYKTFWQLR
ncbi:DUF4352 domain-containing protein [Halobacterium salinarum]|uniref:DUF4352 domain-containing protein n=1 Tax=Halobacterium salinarum TaxID=2242 RepID=UPI0030CE68FA